MLDHVWEWITSDTGWKVATAAFIGSGWIIRRAGKRLRMQIQAIITPLEQDIKTNRIGVAENKAEIDNLSKAARDQNGANEKYFASKEWVQSFVDTRFSGVEREVRDVADSVKALVSRTDNLFTSIMNRNQ